MSLDGGPKEEDLDQTKPGWYLALSAPNVIDPRLAWLDPSRIYSFPKAFKTLVEDLSAPFLEDHLDYVAGIDATGFIIGAAMASRMGHPFIGIRKAGKLCVPTDQEKFTDYQRIEKGMEMRHGAFAKGSCILLVDQWIETGGTMSAAIKLVERQGGVVAGIVAVCIEDTDCSASLQKKYKCQQCVPPSLQQQFNSHKLDSFSLFKNQ